MDLDLENFEIPACSLTGEVDYRNFPWGAYHLNLTPPISVARCNKTGMLFLCPRPNRKNRELMLQGILPEPLRAYGAKIYDYSAVDKLRTSDFEQRLVQFDKIFKARSDKTVLDVGTSGGNFMEVALRHGWQAKGVEPFPGDVDICRKKGLNVVHGFAEQLPFEDSSFDVVHTSHVFEHLEDPLAGAVEAFRVLKPGGMLFIEVPNQLDNFGFHRDMFFRTVQQRKRDVSSIHHLWFFGRKTLQLLYEKAGFIDVKIANKFPPPFPGWRYPFSLTSRLMARIAYGSYIIRGYGFKA